jgi:CBS domain-containing protein
MRPITAADLMNPHILSVRDDLSVAGLTAFLVRNRITGAPVTNANGHLVGDVSVSDLAEASLADLEPRAGSGVRGGPATAAAVEALTVRDIMTASLVSVSEDVTVSEVASKMLEGRLHRVIVNRGAQPIGIITTSDLIGLLVDER